VGSGTFHTTPDILLSQKDSYFHGLLSPHFRDAQTEPNEPLFIARDGESFKYVLEFLTYGQIFTKLPDDGSLDKLMADADFYLLDKLKEHLKTLPARGGTAELGLYCRVGSRAPVANGANITWNVPDRVPGTRFLVQNDTVTVLQNGLYHIFCRYQNTTSTHGQGAANLDMMINGVAVARSYHGAANGYHDGHQVIHLTELEAQSTVQCRYFSNSNGNQISDPLGTNLTILKLS